ncbi:hypothetical protein RUM44_008744 [Polyplax serrata]|uniref:Uncharacterized protein n=1 Tax=Polyplax serrata TaxID=468196 RepID=A0ABR1B950_POLSC
MGVYNAGEQVRRLERIGERHLPKKNQVTNSLLYQPCIDREHAFSQEQKGLRQVRTSGQGVSFHDFLERKFGKVVFSKKKKIIPGYSGATLNDTSLEVEDAFGLILQEQPSCVAGELAKPRN